MVFAAMLHGASQDNDDGIQLKYRTDGGVFNLRRLKARTKVKVATLRELLFADDRALNSNTEVEMQQCVNHFSRACDNFGFTIDQHQEDRSQMAPCTTKDVSEPDIFVNDESLKAADSFTYLGSTLSREANIDVEVNNTFQSQLCIWKTQEESVRPMRNQPRHQAKGIHGCGANRPAIYNVSHGLCTAVTAENSTTSIQNVCGLF